MWGLTSKRPYFLKKEREPGVGKLGLQGNFYTEFKSNTTYFSPKTPYEGLFFNYSEIAIAYNSMWSKL